MKVPQRPYTTGVMRMVEALTQADRQTGKHVDM
jgi:hypothetical protein